jgi:glycosyltransferase involved in cell wall biosynthesis
VDTARRLAERRRAPVRWLVVARDADDSDRRLLEDTLAAQGLRDQFELRYDVPFLEMKRVLRATRVAFIPYPRETNFAARVPIRIFEYMASGVPFVASDLPTTSEFIAGRGVARLVPPGDAEAYAEALAGLLADPVERSAMAARGPDVVRELYNWENEADRLKLLYAELVPREPASRARPSPRRQTSA